MEPSRGDSGATAGAGPVSVPGGKLAERPDGRGQTQAQIRPIFCLSAMASAFCRWCAFILSLSKDLFSLTVFLSVQNRLDGSFVSPDFYSSPLFL